MMLRHLGAAALMLALVAGLGSTAHARPHHQHAHKQEQKTETPVGRGAAIAAEAKKYVGHKPTVAQLKEWARQTGIGAWRWGVRVYCALGINMVLAKLGVDGSGSFTARSFSKWGRATADPKPGDVAVIGGHHVVVVVERDGDDVTAVSFNDAGHAVRKREMAVRQRGVHYRTAA